MTGLATPAYLAFVALASSCALTSYAITARSRNWPVGAMFVRGTIPTLVGLGSIVAALGLVGWLAFSGAHSWWQLGTALLAYFVGGPVIVALLGRHSALLSLVVAPVAAIAAWISLAVVA